MRGNKNVIEIKKDTSMKWHGWNLLADNVGTRNNQTQDESWWKEVYEKKQHETTQLLWKLYTILNWIGMAIQLNIWYVIKRVML